MIVDGFVLTGGASSRMGSDKASLPFGTATLAHRAGQVLEQVAAEVRFAGESAGDIPGVPDIYGPGEGEIRASLVGLHSALFHAASEWIAVLACDLPFVSAGLFHLLVRIAITDDFDAVIPVQPNGRLQPLAALYRRTACLGVAAGMIGDKNFRLVDLASRVHTRYVEPDEYADIDADGDLFFNINTPGDYATAIAIHKRTRRS